MTRPIVLVSADVRPGDGHEWHAAAATYLEAVITGSDAVPLVLPSLGAAIDLDAVLTRVDGVMLTGARSNVHPSLYGGVASAENGPYDPQRDATTLPLARRALELGIPLLAICRGMQELNVALGGTLATEIQSLPGRRDHRAAQSDVQDERYGLAHEIEVEAGSCLAAVLGTAPDGGVTRVNSLHRQAVDMLAPDLLADARAEDGTIEAAHPQAAKGWALATQWHPEYWVASDETSKKIFAAFGKAMRARMRRAE
ncbi:putative glutamine amidotransferase [Breoghania corrubedonensis]|uniref:gamma-glutamyl-gamma-aminobutyrate hydrolase n=1 Tax=Breoghania corrubedonensis TaxID=665038 RepID=A0A2T5V6Q4_9HYPH|nr:gamma-glutamyl-gamma-aminobutyrate hydrolase family protein [Breoghania corrubedonensis]PTW59434.1 putative glutamine amidotransferase [Breoghania corrubedonensis]